MKSVVLADDSPRVRMLMAEFLEEEGFEVVGEAENGAEAVDVTCSLQPDLLLMDARMPGVSGLDALPRLRSQCPETKVVLFTGHDDPWLRDRAQAAGAVDVLIKGDDLEDLVSRLRSVLREGARL